jgi:hypothetical protein
MPSLRGLVVIKGRRPVVGLENDGYDTEDDSDDEGNVVVRSDESKVRYEKETRHC